MVLNIDKYLSLMYAGEFFDAHEELEKFWQELSVDDPRRVWIQALIQFAAAKHLQKQGREEGFQKVMLRAQKNLLNR